MTYKEIKEIIAEVIKEQNTSGAAGTYNTPRAFKRVSRPKRPSHTKMFDFLEEDEQA